MARFHVMALWLVVVSFLHILCHAATPIPKADTGVGRGVDFGLDNMVNVDGLLCNGASDNDFC